MLFCPLENKALCVIDSILFVPVLRQTLDFIRWDQKALLRQGLYSTWTVSISVWSGPTSNCLYYNTAAHASKILLYIII